MNSISERDLEFIEQYNGLDGLNRDMDEFEWEYQDKFKLIQLGDAKEWSEWIEQEAILFKEEFGYDRYGIVAEWWLKNPQEEPIVVAEIPESERCVYKQKYFVWDGNHRVGISNLHNLETAPAFVGKIRK